ncbi:MAG TPA: hypothetical protein VK922_06140 [Gemmatimonadaceae bacterium]|nr:hypothetical protein [Gemmatimonadaceae bacterium]
MRQRVLILLAAALLAACDDSTGTQVVQRNETDLAFLRTADDAPPLASIVASFWAVRGEERELRLSYRSRPGRTDSTEFLRLRIGDASLVTLPSGLPIALGDSLLITVTVIDPARMIVELQPAGLLFARGEPAELEMRYREADPDYDDDGDVDEDDARIEQRLGIWRQEAVGQPWVRISTDVRVDSDDVKADLTGFTRYAIAY